MRFTGRSTPITKAAACLILLVSCGRDGDGEVSSPTTSPNSLIPPLTLHRWESPDEFHVETTTTTTTLPTTTTRHVHRPTRSKGTGHNLAAIRACESNGNYAAVSRSGKYRGAYQFDQQTWDRFADSEWKGKDPASAPPHVQDETASRVTYDAWPNC